MGSLALSRVEVSDQPAPSIADEVARIARQKLAPLAPPSTPARSIRPNCCATSARSGLGQPCPAGRARRSALRHPVDRRARRSLRRHRIHGVVPEHAGLVRRQLVQSEACARFGDGFSSGRVLGGTGLSNPMKTLLRHREVQAEGAQGRGRLHRQGRAALGVQSRPRPFVRHDLRARGRARRHRDVPRRLLRSRHHAAALQAVPRHGRHGHLWRAVPRRVRAGRSDPG